MMEDQKTDIQSRHRELENQDRELRRQALKIVSAQTKPAFMALQAECGETGHKWVFDHHNWNNSYAWDKCEWCGAQTGRRLDNE